MTALTENPVTTSPDARRVRVAADAVVASYINELARPARRPAAIRRPAPVPASSRAPRRGLCAAALAK
jgi:hypothetical protein